MISFNNKRIVVVTILQNNPIAINLLGMQNSMDAYGRSILGNLEKVFGANAK